MFSTATGISASAFSLRRSTIRSPVGRRIPEAISNRFCRSKASFIDAVDQVRASVLQLKSTLGGWAEDSSRWPATTTLLRPPVDRPLDRRARSSPDGARFLLVCVPRPALECLASKKREHRQTPRGLPRCQFGGMSLKGVQRNRTERVRWKRKPANVRSRPQS